MTFVSLDYLVSLDYVYDNVLLVQLPKRSCYASCLYTIRFLEFWWSFFLNKALSIGVARRHKTGMKEGTIHLEQRSKEKRGKRVGQPSKTGRNRSRSKGAGLNSRTQATRCVATPLFMSVWRPRSRRGPCLAPC